MCTPTKAAVDLDYISYSKLIGISLANDHIRENIMQLSVSNKFGRKNEAWLSHPYYGYAIVSMLSDSALNTPLINYIKQLRITLKKLLNASPSFYMLPAQSYHQTMANTLSGQRFAASVKSRDAEEQYIQHISEALTAIRAHSAKAPLKLHIEGLHAFGSCIALLCSVSEDDYEIIKNFRYQFYNYPSFDKYGVKCTRPFIGHITVAYMVRQLALNERDNIAQKIIELNEGICDINLDFYIERCELRQYNNLSAFHSKPTYPAYNFI